MRNAVSVPGNRRTRHAAALAVMFAGCASDVELKDPEPPTAAEVAKLTGEVESLLDSARWDQAKTAVSGQLRQAIRERARARLDGRLDDLTGIGSVRVVKPFVAHMRKLLLSKRWAELTPWHRAKLLRDGANTALAAVEVVEIKSFIPVQDRPAPASFEHDDWEVIVHRRLVENASPNREEAIQLAQLTLHEARHAEQVFRVARLLAGRGKTITQISQAFDIRSDIAENASLRPLLEHASSETQLREAITWYPVHGPKRDEYSTVGKQANRAVGALNQQWNKTRDAVASLKQNVTAQSFRALVDAKNQLKQQVERTQRAFGDYLDVPTEADAYEVGAMVWAAFGDTP